MHVILSEAKDLTVGMCVYCNHLKVNEAKMTEGGSKIGRTDERSLASLGMTEQEAKDLAVGMRVCRNQLNVNGAKMIQVSLEILRTDERSLASLGMTEQGSEGRHELE